MNQGNLIRIFFLGIVLTGCFLVALSAKNANPVAEETNKECVEKEKEPAKMQGEFIIWESLGQTVLIGNVRG
jgi:hypothetical protein